MNTCVISLSSNLDKNSNMEKAGVTLKTLFADIVFSSKIETEPIGNKYEFPFLNSAARFSCCLSKEELTGKLKEIEVQLGRTAELRAQKKVPIDLDIICWNDEVVHPDYNRFSFLPGLISELFTIN